MAKKEKRATISEYENATGSAKPRGIRYDDSGENCFLNIRYWRQAIWSR